MRRGAAVPGPTDAGGLTPTIVGVFPCGGSDIVGTSGRLNWAHISYEVRRPPLWGRPDEN